MPRSNRPRSSPYVQTGIGDCGHVVGTWPQISGLGGRDARVICDTCTKEKYGILSEENLIIVRLKTPPKPDWDEADPSVPQPRKKPPKKKAKTGLALLLEQEGFF